MTNEFLYQVGNNFSFERQITEEDVKRFAEVVGDLNPIHLDADFAESSFFKKRIVHGAFLGGLISKILGMDFPGPGTVYISQNTTFKRPVFVDSSVKAEVTVVEVLDSQRRLVLETNIFNEEGKTCMTGTATVWMPE